MRPWDRLRLRAAITLERRPDAREADSGRSSFSANHTTSFFFVSGFGSGAYSAKLLAGTRHRFSGFSQPRQCGDDVLRILVTGGPPVRRSDTDVRLHHACIDAWTVTFDRARQ